MNTNNSKYWTSERFFARLEFFLDTRGITFNQLSQESETSISSIYQIRRRKALPNFQTLCCICDALGITLYEFFDADNTRTVATEQVIWAMKRLSAECQNLLVQMVKHMK